MVLISVSAFGGYTIYKNYYDQRQQLINAINQITLTLNFTVTHNGKSYSTIIPNDLLTDNFYKLMLSLFTPCYSSSTQIVYTVVLTSNVPDNVVMWNCNSSTSIFGFASTFNAINGGVIEIGTSSITPKTSDYNLNTAFQTYFTTTSSCNIGTTDNIVTSGSESISSSASITETGLLLDIGSIYILLSHDTFSAIVVNSGDTVTVSYTLNLNNVGFNNNLCQILYGILQYEVGNAVLQITLTDITGTSYIYCIKNPMMSSVSILTAINGASCTSSSWSGGSNYNFIQMAIGTAANTFTPSSYALTSQIASTVITNNVYSSTNAQVYYTTTFTLPNTKTIAEAGLFLQINTITFLMFAINPTATVFTANTPTGITLYI